MRRRYYKVSDELIASLLVTRGPQTTSIEGVPADAKLISLHHDPLNRVTNVVFEHESFEDLPEGVSYMPGPNPIWTSHVEAPK